MRELPILPTTLYEFDIPDEVYKRTLKAYEKLEINRERRRDSKPHYGISHLGENGLHREESFKEITKLSNEKLGEVANKVKYNRCMEDLRVCLMWINVSEKGRWHHRHHHPWSLLSGIIYLKGESGKTWFSRKSEYSLSPLMNTPTSAYLETENLGEMEVIHKHSPKEGTMIIFPSTLIHSVDANQSEEDRVTISFNSFPAGTTGSLERLSGLRFSDIS